MYTIKHLQRAIDMVTTAHREHFDRNGVPYIYHLFYVSSAQDTMEGKILGLLHDSVEDGKLTMDEIRFEFGGGMADMVDVVTRGKEESYNNYISRLLEHEVTSRMKLTDIEHNTLIGRMDEKAAKRFNMYREAYERICDKLNIRSRYFIDHPKS